ncbi:heat shock protein beta-9 [Alosa sapidissima]|uniref:heat shock protein beta-9 n=1 Tax=Alosa sapidissima TaxID=34773 RepID=UPI001C09050D|nr:heat shock protein beta-9 [Alosa sapidissima]
MAMSTSESIFKDDPFFNEARFLLPMQRSSPLSSRLMPDMTSLREDFFSRRAQLVQSLRSDMRSTLLNELCDGLPAGLFQTLDALRSSSSSPSSSSSSPASLAPSTSSPSPSPTRVVSTAVQPMAKQDSPLVINTRGFSPEDIRVTVSGRQLEVMATKRAEAADSSSTSSPTGRCLASAASARQQGFIQRVQLPEGVEPSDVTCSMGEDGLLRIETHQSRKEVLEEPKEPEEKREEVKDAMVASVEEAAPVRYRTSLDFPITRSAGPEVTFNKSL